MQIPKSNQETAIYAYRDEENWLICTSDRTMWSKLDYRGWKKEKSSGGYRTYRVPIKAITFRAKSAVEASRKKSKKMKGASFGKQK